MQHAEETDFCTEMFGIARDFEKSFRTGAKQQAIDEFLICSTKGASCAGSVKTT